MLKRIRRVSVLIVIAASQLALAQVLGGEIGGPGMPQDQVFQNLMLDQVNFETRKKADLERQKKQQDMLKSGLISALDLQAPASAMNEFNAGAELMTQHKEANAAPHFENAIRAYPNFVSAHNSLGQALLEMGQDDRARQEFEAALNLDDHFSGALINLSRLYLAEKKWAEAENALTRASSMMPSSVEVQAALATAQFGNDEYEHVLQTAVHVHGMQHAGFASVHVVAGDAAVRMKSLDAANREYKMALQEDPAGPLAPKVKIQLQAIAAYRESLARHPGQSASVEEVVKTFPNSDRLRAALLSLQSDEDSCADCDGPAPSVGGAADPNLPRQVTRSNNQWTLKAVVDEVAVMFSVTQGSTPVENLTADDFVIRDANLPPAKLLKFENGAKLPLRLGLLIDASDSIQKRFDFEKDAAQRFLTNIVTGPADLAFVGGFTKDVDITQDFTRNHAKLANGIAGLKAKGATALFDAVAYACWKLAAYPDKDRVAKVLVILTDGEDNISRITLRQAIADAENAGVTVYVISTKQPSGNDKYGQVHAVTDADHLLEAIAERTGGEAMFPGDFQNLDKAFEKLRTAIRSRYLIAYKPAQFEADGRFRPIVIRPRGTGLKVHARKGYFAPRG